MANTSSSSNPINPGIKMTDLKSRIMRPSLSSIYGVIIKTPSSANSGFKFEGFDRDLFELTCVEATLPGSSLGTIETNRDFRGVVERHAYSKLYDETIDFTFMVTMDPENNPQKSYLQIKFFEAWMRYIVGENVGDTELRKPSFQSSLRYPKQYQADLAIIKFEKDLGAGINRTSNILAYEFVQAFPKSIASIPVSYDGSQVLKTTVSFTYTRYFVSEVSTKIDGSFVPEYSIGNPEVKFNPELFKEGLIPGLSLDIYNNTDFDTGFGSSLVQPFRLS